MTARVVLVHGSWLGAWCWDRVVERLAAEHVTAVAVDLELVTLERDADIVSRVVAEQRATGERVLLVGHSYAGMVISAAGYEADELIYVCAVLPARGESMLDALSASEMSEYAATLTDVRDGMVVVNPERAAEGSYHRCPPDVAKAAIPRLRPLGWECMDTAVADPAWLHVETSYVVCTDDRSIPVALQRDFAARVQHAFELDADHSPFYSAIDPLAEAIAQRATAV
jgi:pimeloyl-ACP methyl ester carboxylesterase